MAQSTPAAEFRIDATLVRDLLTEQHGDLAALPLREVEAGWDNAMFRLGSELAVRLPRRALAARLILHEQRWLPELACVLPLPVPQPVRAGVPGCGYPWHWSIVPWLPGTPADLAAPASQAALALGAFLRALHRPAPVDAPRNPYRGVPLEERASTVAERMRRVARHTELIDAGVRQAWEAALDAPPDAPSAWLHGDLHARNVLTEAGAITAVIDWGDLTAGDPATDLAALWMLLPDAKAREAALQAYGGVSEATLRRARGWAVFFGVVFADSGLAGEVRHARMGADILRRI